MSWFFFAPKCHYFVHNQYIQKRDLSVTFQFHRKLGSLVRWVKISKTFVQDCFAKASCNECVIYIAELMYWFPDYPKPTHWKYRNQIFRRLNVSANFFCKPFTMMFLILGAIILVSTMIFLKLLTSWPRYYVSYYGYLRFYYY